MEIKLRKCNCGSSAQNGANGMVAEVIADGIILSGLDDALDIMGQCYFAGADAIVMNASNITPEFFDLSTCLAGEVLQKFSTYGVRLAIVGDFSDGSGHLRDFIRESNNRGHTFFAATAEDALAKLAATAKR